MSLPRYQVLLIDINTGSTLAVFDSVAFWDLKYSRTLNGIGRIAMTMPGINQYRSLFQLDNILEVYRTDPTSTISALVLEETYLIRVIHRFREENDERFVVGGVSLNQLLTRRLIDPADDPGQAGGYSTKAGAADTVIHDYCIQQIGQNASAARQMPGLTINPVIGSGLSVGGRYRFENLFDCVKDLAHRGFTDFQIRRTSGKSFEMNIGTIGSNKTKSVNYPWNSWVGLNPDRGNLQRPSYQFDRTDEKNYVYELGQGQGANRTFLVLPGDSITDSPLNRCEFTEDARHVEKVDSVSLLTAARISLWNHYPKIEFTFEPTGLEPGNIYRQDWDIGDVITATWDEYNEDLRMTGIEITVSGSAGETIQVQTSMYQAAGT